MARPPRCPLYLARRAGGVASFTRRALRQGPPGTTVMGNNGRRAVRASGAMLVWLSALSCSSGAPSATVRGAVVGPITGAVVQAFSVRSDGAIGAPASETVQTDGSGGYALQVRVAAGPLLIRSTGGTQRSWVTGRTTVLDASASLTALLSAAGATSSTTTANLTALSTIAATFALATWGSGDGDAAIRVAKANESIGDYFGLAGWGGPGASPFDPTRLDGADTATQAEIDYGLVLAGLSQVAEAAGLDPAAFTAALAHDASDGAFDGLQGSAPLVVAGAAGAASVPLSSSAANTQLGDAIQDFQQSRTLNDSGNRAGVTASPTLLAKLSQGSGQIALGKTVAAPILLPTNDSGPGGSATVSRKTPIAITTTTAGAAIRYTTDGSTPTTAHGTVYDPATPIVVSTSTTVKAIASASGMTDSAVSSVRYEVYKSPYDVRPLLTEPGLESDFAERDKLDPSTLRVAHWYLPSSYSDRQLTWGPRPRQYPAEAGAPHSAEWKRQRVLAVALRLLDAQYQHHHLAQWDPPQTWSMQTVLLGHPSRGIDCSSFALWSYDYGLGFTFTGDVGDQAGLTKVTGPGGEDIPVTKILRDGPTGNFSADVHQLKTGDLLYVKPSKSSALASHVIMWIGQVNGTGDYLVIDSHDQLKVADNRGVSVPTGVQIRPFREGSWYYQCLLNVNRLVR